MGTHEVFRPGDGREIAYYKLPADGAGVNAPGVVFLGGFKSDMAGTKAVYLEDWARQAGIGFLRLDYTGHGASSGEFLDGCIGDWARDAEDAITALTQGPQILVGSSMGGWISLILAKRLPDRIAGLVGIAAAPDFTENGMWAGFSEDERATLMRDGQIAQPSEYSDEPYIITRRLIEDGRAQCVLNAPLSLPFPVRLLHGTADEDVPMDWTLQMLAHAIGPDIHATFVQGADHRMSTPSDLALLTDTLEALLKLRAGDHPS